MKEKNVSGARSMLERSHLYSFGAVPNQKQAPTCQVWAKAGGREANWAAEWARTSEIRAQEYRYIVLEVICGGVLGQECRSKPIYSGQGGKPWHHNTCQ
jgi:hypothetical protein